MHVEDSIGTEQNVTL